MARPVDAQGPLAVVHAQAEAAAGRDSPRGAAVLVAVANDSSSAPAAVVEPREVVAPPEEVAPVAARQVVQ